MHYIWPVTVYKGIPDLKSEKDMYIVIRLEGFGLLMLLLGRIETIMETCGLAETMETVYAPNIVAHRLEGKAYGEL